MSYIFWCCSLHLVPAQLVLHLGADICQFRTASVTCAKLMYYAAGMGSFQFWL